MGSSKPVQKVNVLYISNLFKVIYLALILELVNTGTLSHEFNEGLKGSFLCRTSLGAASHAGTEHPGKLNDAVLMLSSW